jgi:hypothetical protein
VIVVVAEARVVTTTTTIAARLRRVEESVTCGMENSLSVSRRSAEVEDVAVWVRGSMRVDQSPRGNGTQPRVSPRSIQSAAGIT